MCAFSWVECRVMFAGIAFGNMEASGTHLRIRLSFDEASMGDQLVMCFHLISRFLHLFCLDPGFAYFSLFFNCIFTFQLGK